jgi:hypothetical protein
VLQPPPSPPGPIAVLGELVRCGRTPPPQLIIFAIAEAEATGRDDIVADIVRLYIAPVVYSHELAHARSANPTPAPKATAARPQLAARPAPTAQAAAPASTFPASDEQIRKMLDHDPEQFMEMARRPGGVIDVPAEAVIEVPSAPAAPRERKAGTVIDIDIEDEDRALPETSPIASVAPADWTRFCERLTRETPDYKSNRHVGKFRQNVERLIELGINPQEVLGSARAQRDALGVEMADAFQHATESGLVKDHVHRLIALPGDTEAYTVTLSGMLGVIQCAGLDNAVSWFESKLDRKKFPHTTSAFRNTNGAF